MNSGTWMVTPLLSFAGFVLAVLVAVFMMGAVSTTSSSAVAGSRMAIGRPFNHSAWKLSPDSSHAALVAHHLIIERVLLVVLRIHHMNPVGVPVHDLEVLGVEPGILHEFGGAETGIEGVAARQVAQADLHERPQVARGAMLKIHDAARVAIDHQDVTAADITGLHDSVLR